MVSYSVNLLVLFLFKDSGFAFDYVVANLSGFTVAVMWSFFWNSRFVFAPDDKNHKFGWDALLKTYASNAVSGIILSNLLSSFWIYVLGVPKWATPVLNLPITMPVNFILSKKWAYRVPEDRSDS